MQLRGPRLGAAHAEGVPVVAGDDGVIAVDERVHQLRVLGIGGVEPVQAQPGPHRAEGGEDLRPGEGVTAVAGGHGRGVAAEQHEVVAGLADPEGVDLAGDGALLHEPQGVDAAVGEHLRHPRPHQMHVDREGRRGRRRRQALLQQRSLGEPQPRAAERGRGQDAEISGILQFGEVILGKDVVTVDLGGTGAEPLQQLVGKEGGGIESGHRSILPLHRWQRGKMGE